MLPSHIFVREHGIVQIDIHGEQWYKLSTVFLFVTFIRSGLDLSAVSGNTYSNPGDREMPCT